MFAWWISTQTCAFCILSTVTIRLKLLLWFFLNDLWLNYHLKWGLKLEWLINGAILLVLANIMKHILKRHVIDEDASFLKMFVWTIIKFRKTTKFKITEQRCIPYRWINLMIWEGNLHYIWCSFFLILIVQILSYLMLILSKWTIFLYCLVINYWLIIDLLWIFHITL